MIAFWRGVVAAVLAVLCASSVVCASAHTEAQQLQDVFLELCGNESAAEATTRWALSEAALATHDDTTAPLPSCAAVTGGLSWTVEPRAPNVGAHRSLDATLRGSPDLLARTALVFAIDRAAFVDVDQSALQNPTAHVRVRADTGAAAQDLEAPVWAAAARPALAVVVPAPPSRTTASLDVHLRYQAPRAGGGYHAHTRAVPAAFLYAPCTEDDGRAAFRLLPPTHDDGATDLLGDVRVPVADTRHRVFVTPITFVCTILGALAVVFAVRS